MLEASVSGDLESRNQLFALVYEELRRRAHFRRMQWQGDLTLNTTALVHEAYLKMIDQTQVKWNSRAHFLAIGAEAIRQILIDYARSRKALKRGGNISKLSLEKLPEEEHKIFFHEETATKTYSTGRSACALSAGKRTRSQKSWSVGFSEA